MSGTKIGPAIRSQRELRGLSQSRLARQAGVSQPYLSQLEAGTRRRASAAVVQRLAEALDVPVSRLLRAELEVMGRGRTEVWLHQVRERAEWGFEDFCREVREGRQLAGTWDLSRSKIYRLGGRVPMPGDLIVLLFTASDATEPGICRVGVVTEFSPERHLRFRGLPPTASLQAGPLWSTQVQGAIKSIRSATVDEGTMWRVTRPRDVRALFAQIFREFLGPWLSDWAKTGKSLIGGVKGAAAVAAPSWRARSGPRRKLA